MRSIATSKGTRPGRRTAREKKIVRSDRPPRVGCASIGSKNHEFVRAGDAGAGGRRSRARGCEPCRRSPRRRDGMGRGVPNPPFRSEGPGWCQTRGPIGDHSPIAGLARCGVGRASGGRSRQPCECRSWSWLRARAELTTARTRDRRSSALAGLGCNPPPMRPRNNWALRLTADTDLRPRRSSASVPRSCPAQTARTGLHSPLLAAAEIDLETGRARVSL